MLDTFLFVKSKTILAQRLDTSYWLKKENSQLPSAWAATWNIHALCAFHYIYMGVGENVSVYLILSSPTPGPKSMQKG